MKVPKIFNNEVVHYALIFLAVLNVVGYVAAKAYECLLLFGVGYYAANTYIKNVGVSILAALFLSNFVFGCGRVTESFIENMKGSREHMQDAKMSAQKAAFSLMESMQKKKQNFSNKEGFFGRRTIEAMTQAEDGLKKATENVSEIVTLGEDTEKIMEEAEEKMEKAVEESKEDEKKEDEKKEDDEEEKKD